MLRRCRRRLRIRENPLELSAHPFLLGKRIELKKQKREVEDWDENSIQKFQGMMCHIYFKRDVERGADGTLKWLKEEVEELGEAMKGSDKRALEDEFADVLAWLASLANVLQVDLEEAALRKYDNKCPRCRSSLCKCAFKGAKG